MNIRELKAMSKKRTKLYRNKAINALEIYLEAWEPNNPVRDELSKSLDELYYDNPHSALTRLHNILADGYYADDILCDYKNIKSIYSYIIKYDIYKTLENGCNSGLKHLKEYEEMGY